MRSADLASRRRLVAGVAVAAATVALFFVSRGKWSDPMIDSGREWIVPDALARGELLYRDVVYWFGPFTPYLHAVFFRLFGSSFASLVAAGILASVGALSALFLALSRVTERRDAVLWTMLAIPVLIFMPHAGGSILGMGYRIWHAATFTLLAVTVGSRPAAARLLARPFAAGSLCALAGLCRLEWGLVALGAVFLAVALRERFRRPFWKETAAAGLAFFILFGGVVGAFILFAGREAVIDRGHVLLSSLPEETRTFLVAFSGILDWRKGLAELLYSASMWVGVLVLVEVAVFWKRDPSRVRRALRSMAIVLAVLGLTAILGGASRAVLFSAAPLLCLAGLFLGWRRAGEPSAPALAAFGFAGLLLSYRRPFHISDSGYVAPPLLLAFVCAAGLLHLAILLRHGPPLREQVRSAVRFALAGLIVLAFAGRFVQYLDWDGTPVPGTGGLLLAREDLSRELSDLAKTIRRDTAEGEGLVVFPEGEILNYLSGRPNPIPHKLYLPGYLTDANEERVLSELEHAPPAAIVLWRRTTGEYGRAFFGNDYGRRIARWIEANYAMKSFRAEGNPPRANPVFSYGLRKPGA